MRSRTGLTATLVAGLACAAGPAAAQSYPARPVMIVVPFAELKRFHFVAHVEPRRTGGTGYAALAVATISMVKTVEDYDQAGLFVELTTRGVYQIKGVSGEEGQRWLARHRHHRVSPRPPG